MDMRRYPALDWNGDVSLKERKTAVFGFSTRADRLSFIAVIRGELRGKTKQVHFATARLPDTRA
jgi:hypothetical protein